jgi:hypothetical protein
MRGSRFPSFSSWDRVGKLYAMHLSVGTKKYSKVPHLQKTTSSITTFLLAMVLFPDVQKRVQAELDAVVGRKRLPTFEDRTSLPYLEATIKESLRFHPPTPLGIAHRLCEDDVVQGTLSYVFLSPGPVIR